MNRSLGRGPRRILMKSSDSPSSRGLRLGIKKNQEGQVGGASHRMCHSALRRAMLRENPRLRRYRRLAENWAIVIANDATMARNDLRPENWGTVSTRTAGRTSPTRAGRTTRELPAPPTGVGRPTAKSSNTVALRAGIRRVAIESVRWLGVWITVPSRESQVILFVRICFTGAES